jgi:ankyrin repeat protein
LLDEALSWAARNDRCEAMAALVGLGANVNSNPYRGTPLLWAIYADRVSAAAWLLDHGADPNLRHDFGGAGHGVGAVAMHLAAQYSCLKCLRLLLERGADRTIKDAAYGGTPLEWAEENGAADAVALLR